MKFWLLIAVTVFQFVGNSSGFSQSRKLPKKDVSEQADLWKDTDGNVINAHGGGMLQHKGMYYWFGEIKRGKTWLVPGQNWECYRVSAGGISCYSSKDLKTWTY